VRILDPREKRIVVAALVMALVVSLAWTTWLAHLGLERARVTPPRLVLAILVFGVHYVGAIVVLL
jgi:hypothetical protein